MATVKKVSISPVFPTEIHHHRDLPVGKYKVVLSGFRQQLYLIEQTNTKGLYLIQWMHKAGPMIRVFEVKEDGSLVYEESSRAEDSYPG